MGLALEILQAAFAHRPLSRLACWRGPRSAARVAITLDDGPNEHTTPQVLAILRRTGVRATFFLLGREVAKFPDTARRIAADGHEVGIHGYDHAFSDLEGQVTACERALAACGIVPRLVRPPAGRINGGVLRWRLRSRFPAVFWSFDVRDSMRHEGKWHGGRPDFSGLRGGDIILMHDDNPVCVAELPELIESARRGGLEPATVTELIG
jgi:peptidoglycan/xylan/chitin deacetylase (PgdA/CDA1 family)